MRRLFAHIFHTQLQSGQSLLELLVLIGIAAIFLPALLTGLVASREGKAQQKQRIEAASILKETNEAVRIIREAGWDTLALSSGEYHIVQSGNSWTIATGAASLTGGFTQAVEISDVYRDTNGAIVTTGGNLDASTKRIVTTISWGSPIASSVESTMYLTRFLENEAYTETTQTQFNAGTLTGVAVRGTSGSSTPDDGEVLLGSGGHSDWCGPELLANTEDLPGNGIANGIFAIEGKAFAGTGENASGISFLSILIDNNYPPDATYEAQFDGYKTNSIFGEQNYGYISTDTNSKEVVIINIASIPFTEIGTFDAPGNTSGESVYVLGNTGYVTVNNRLYNFNLDSKTGSRAARDADGVALSGFGQKVIVVGNYAYVGISGSTSRELEIVDVSNPNNMQVVGWANLDSQSTYDVFVNSAATRAYIATGISGTQREMHIVDISNKTGSRPIIGTGYEANGMDPNGVTVVPGNRAILVGTGGEEYQVIDISNESSPSRCGGEEVDIGIQGVASVLEADGDAYSYIISVTGDEFRIIAGGPGGSYVSEGIFESQTFNPGYTTANNRFTATFDEPAGTNIEFQVSLASLVGGVCPSTGQYTFVGPDGTSGTRFSMASGAPITFPFTSTGTYSNPGQCFRYRAYLSTTNQSSTPVLYDVTINYSP